MYHTKGIFIFCLKTIFYYFITILINPQVLSCQDQKDSFKETLKEDRCTYLSTGRNAFFILEPNYQLILEGKEDDQVSQLVITVLNETKTIGGIETRVVEERESENGELVEISRNFFAMCKETGSIHYFGEEVDIYKKGKIVSHEGAWIAEGNNKSGIIMPGVILQGAKYYQEYAPGIAMDRAEIISTSEMVKTPSGYFINCLKTEETNALKPKEKEYKYYAPGVGLIQEEELLLVKHGFIKPIKNEK